MNTQNHQSDVDAVRTAREQDLPVKKRIATWTERYDNSAPLQREFKSVEAYSGYMEGLFSGRARHAGYGSPYPNP